MSKALEWFFEVKENTRPYQKSVLVISFVTMLTSNAIIMGLPIILLDPNLICYEKDTQLSENHGFRCSMREACSGEYWYVIDDESSIGSLTREYELLCEERYLADLVGSASFFGKTAGYFFFTFYLDMNKPLINPLMQCLFLSSIVGLLSLFSIGVLFYVVLIAIYFFLNSGLVTLVFSHTVEVMQNNPHLKETCVQIIYVGWALSSPYLVALCLISPNWRVISAIYNSLPLLLLVLKYPNIITDYLQFISNRSLLHGNTSDEKAKVNQAGTPSPWNLLKYKSLRMITILTCIFE